VHTTMERSLKEGVESEAATYLAPPMEESSLTDRVGAEIILTMPGAGVLGRKRASAL
jgi:hypothetical protein